MRQHSGFADGVLAGLLLSLGAQAIHWFITPMAHPDASTARELGVVIQAAVGFGGALWLCLRQRRRTTLSTAA
jgi:hypothetical protein